jgi:hypothetical protein
VLTLETITVIGDDPVIGLSGMMTELRLARATTQGETICETKHGRTYFNLRGHCKTPILHSEIHQ